MAQVFIVQGESISLEVVALREEDGITYAAVRTGGREFEVRVLHYGKERFVLIFDDKPYEVLKKRTVEGNIILVGGQALLVKANEPRKTKLRRKSQQAEIEKVTANMPGLVIEVKVKVGDQVTKRQGVVVLEAMKMQNEIFSTREGIVKTVSIMPGASVMAGQVLLTIEQR